MFLSPEIILKAYTRGIFPMSDSFDDPFIYWVDPQIRGIIKKVINLCAKNTNRNKTWINKQIISNYIKLFQIGKAKSVECYYKDKLAGGLYGIIIGNIFCGESMFSIEKDASKISLVYLAAHLKEGGFKFIDTQFYSDHLKQFGTKKIIRNDYKELLSNNKKLVKYFPENISNDILNYFK